MKIHKTKQIIITCNIGQIQIFEVTRTMDSVNHLVAFDNIWDNHGNIFKNRIRITFGVFVLSNKDTNRKNTKNQSRKQAEFLEMMMMMMTTTMTMMMSMKT